MSNLVLPMQAHTAGLNCLQVGSGWFPEQGGGLNRYFYDLIHHLPAEGVQCRGLVAGSAEQWPDAATNGVRAFAALDASMLYRWRAERHTVREEFAANRFDLAAAHFAPYAWPVLKTVKSRMPFVVHFHGPWAQESRQEGGCRLAVAAKAWIEKRVYRQATRLITLSAAFAGVLCHDYAVSREQIDIVPGGVDCDRFDIAETKSQARAKLGWPADRPIVLAVRRLARRMGLENLIDAAASLKKNVPDVLMFIAGSGGLSGELAARINDRALTEHVRLLGFLPDADLPRAYRSADVSIVPTVALEGFGLIAAESLSAGTPVIVTPVGGLPEVVAGLADSLLLAGSGAAVIADRLSSVLRNPGQLPAAAACRAHARTHFDWSIVAQGLRRSYEKALA